jgi:elongator complex protein 3
VDFTKVKEWKQAGTWKPYAEATPDAADLKRVLVYRQKITPPWVRVNRIQRDFKEAKNGALGYTSESIKTNLSQIVHDEAEKLGIYCQCIRCCEVSNEKYNKDDIQYTIRPFTASGAQEVYVSAEIPRPNRPMVIGFIRLRLGNALEDSIIPELKGKTAMIRELHVYGRVKQVGFKDASGAQHFGVGKSLLKIAEDISKKHGYDQIAIISGIGVRDYYRKRGYELRGSYMMKNIERPSNIISLIPYLIISYIMVLMAIAFNYYIYHV